MSNSRTTDLGTWLTQRPETKQVQVLPSSYAGTRIRFDLHDAQPDEVDAVIGELAAVRAWLGRKPA